MIKKTIALAVSSVILLGACNSQNANQPMTNTQATAQKTAQNPLMSPSTLQYQAPDFTVIKDEHIAPAFELGFEQQLREVDDIIAQNTVTFENTIVALEKSGAQLSRASAYFSNVSGTDSNPTRRALAQQFSPLMAQHFDNIYLNDKLFARVQEIHDKRTTLNLDAESVRLIEVYYKRFVRAGAKLNESQKTQIRALNKEHSQLTTQFSQNLLQETQNIAVVVEDKTQLKGLADA